MVDTMGLIWSLVVHSAGIQDNDTGGAGEALWRVASRQWVPRLKTILCDSAYRGRVLVWSSWFGWKLQRVIRPDFTRGFTVEPKRWVVERTFAWLGRWRRLSKDYEQRRASSESLIYLAMTYLMSRRIAHG
jgi:Transposase DDE domain.